MAVGRQPRPQSGGSYQAPSPEGKYALLIHTSVHECENSDTYQ